MLFMQQIHNFNNYYAKRSPKFGDLLQTGFLIYWVNLNSLQLFAAFDLCPDLVVKWGGIANIINAMGFLKRL